MAARARAARDGCHDDEDRIRMSQLATYHPELAPLHARNSPQPSVLLVIEAGGLGGHFAMSV
jgi:hypothetical protein